MCFGKKVPVRIRLDPYSQSDIKINTRIVVDFGILFTGVSITGSFRVLPVHIGNSFW
jgi:hypothetical protein